MKDLISIKDLSKKKILDILNLADNMENSALILKGKILACLFFEPSTRTRLSFESAMIRLGGDVIGFSGTDNTSIKKGETLKDTIKVVENYCDAIVIRHPQKGSAQEAADISKIPVINAGDGSNQHPSQTLLDLYTIKNEIGRLDNLKIGFIGDLKFSRTVHSLSHALSHFGAQMYLISPKNLEMPKDHIDELKKIGTEIQETNDLNDFLPDLDILYVTRIQEERFDSEEELTKVKGSYIVDRQIVEKCKKDVIIMSPLPKLEEISEEVDNMPQAAYFRQAANGIPVRKAILALILGGVK